MFEQKLIYWQKKKGRKWAQCEHQKKWWMDGWNIKVMINELTCSRRRSKIRLIFSSRRLAAVFNLSFRAFRSSILCFSNISLFRLISSAWTCNREQEGINFDMFAMLCFCCLFHLHLNDNEITFSFSFKSDMIASRFSSECSILVVRASFVWVINSALSSSFLRDASSILACFDVQTAVFFASKLC